MIHITSRNEVLPEGGGVHPSAPSASSSPFSTSNPVNDFAEPNSRTIECEADGRASALTHVVRTTPLKSKDRNDADGADANHSVESVSERTLWRATI
jgi:hypothetical protein